MDLTRRRTAVVLTGFMLLLASVPTAQVAEGEEGLEFKRPFYSGPTQRGTSLAFQNASDLYWAGVSESPLPWGSFAMAVSYKLDSSGAMPMRLSEWPQPEHWSFGWPAGPTGSGPNDEAFDGIVATRGGLFFAGRSRSQTQDGVGDKEHKAVLVKFPLTPSKTASGFGIEEWVVKPNFFTYRGNESFLGLAFGADRSGAAHYLYASGYGQTNGVNNTALLAQYTSEGTLRWSRVLGNTGWFMSSFGTAVTTLNGDAYVAGLTHYPYYLGSSSLRLALWKYDDAGNQLWVRSQPGFLPGWRGAMAVTATRRYQSTGEGDIYVVGGLKNGPQGGTDVLMVKYDEAGNLLWRTTWGGAAEDIAHGVAANDHARTPPEGQRLYVTGTTHSFGSGAADMFVLEVNPADGSVLAHYTFGGAYDDVAWGIQKVGSHVYVIGESKSVQQIVPEYEGRFNYMTLLMYKIKPVETSLTVQIDIKPNTTENRVNPKSQGKIPVAILSTGRFAAPEVVKQDTLTFGRAGTEQSLAFCKPEDVNADGQLDLMCHFETEQAAFEMNDTQGILKGLTRTGTPLKGVDSISIVPGAR